MKVHCSRCVAPLLVGLLGCGNALANKVTELSVHKPEPLAVKVASSNGDKYTHVVETGELKFRLKADCRVDKKPGFQEHALNELGIMTPGLKHTLLQPTWPYFGDNPPSLDYYVETKVDEIIRMSTQFMPQHVPKYLADPVKACNDALDKKLDAAKNLWNMHHKLEEGLNEAMNKDAAAHNHPPPSPWQFLAEGFDTSVPNGGEVKVTLRCNPATKLGFTGFHDQSETYDLKIKCLPSPEAQAKLDKSRPKKAVPSLPTIQAVQLKLDPTNHYGQCPVNIKVDASITLNYPAEIEYQYIGDKGHKSPVFTLKKKNQGGTWNLAPWSRKIAIPNTIGQLGTGNNEKVFKHQGWMKVRILSPKPQDFPARTFVVRCFRQPAKGPAGIVAPTPGPKPALPKLGSPPSPLPTRPVKPPVRRPAPLSAPATRAPAPALPAVPPGENGNDAENRK